VSTTRNILLFLHITSVVVAFAPASVHPLLGRQFGEDGPAALQRFSGFAARNSRRVYAPALLLAGLFGILLVIDSDYIDFDQTWISLALLVWIAMNGVVHAVIVPAERKVGEGDAEAAKRLDLGGGLVTVLFLVMLYLMIWKPGL
jgi:uncharacterized membrane protein